MNIYVKSMYRALLLGEKYPFMMGVDYDFNNGVKYTLFDQATRATIEIKINLNKSFQFTISRQRNPICDMASGRIIEWQ